MMRLISGVSMHSFKNTIPVRTQEIYRPAVAARSRNGESLMLRMWGSILWTVAEFDARTDRAIRNEAGAHTERSTLQAANAGFVDM